MIIFKKSVSHKRYLIPLGTNVDFKMLQGMAFITPKDQALELFKVSDIRSLRYRRQINLCVTATSCGKRKSHYYKCHQLPVPKRSLEQYIASGLPCVLT